MTKLISHGSSAGQIKLISLKRFLRQLERQVENSPYYGFNTLQHSESLFSEYASGPSETSTYTTHYVRLLLGRQDQILSAALSYQASTRHALYKAPKELLEDAALASLMDFGNPTHAVRVGRRTWLVTSMDDFRVAEGPHGYALACLARVRTVLIRVHKMTEKQAQAKIAELHENS